MNTSTVRLNLPIIQGLNPCNTLLQRLHTIEIDMPGINIPEQDNIEVALVKQPAKKIPSAEKPMLYIKNMVSLRCKMAVKEELKKLGLHYIFVELGVVDILEDLTPYQREQLKENLLKVGLELMGDKKSILVENIKNVITKMIHYAEELTKMKYSEYLSEELNHDYGYLSNIFKEAQGISIQQYIILHKIEYIKELLVYDELNLTEIAYKMDYSSVAHLCNQFKKMTGLTPSYFKSLKLKKRAVLENL